MNKHDDELLQILGQYAYLLIRYYHDTWVPIRYVLRFLSIAILVSIKVNRFFFPPPLTDICKIKSHKIIGLHHYSIKKNT